MNKTTDAIHPLILHLETATPVCSVALSCAGKILSVKETDEEKSHATRLTLLIDEVLKETGYQCKSLHALSLSIGPGSYTGLRVGASVVKGIAYAMDIPVIGVGTLTSMAYGMMKSLGITPAETNETDPWLCPMLDARRSEVYATFLNFALVEMRAISADPLIPGSYTDILDSRRVIFFGSGCQKARDIILHPNATFDNRFQVSATYQATPSYQAFLAGRFLDTAYFEPHYLKEFIATIPRNKVIDLSSPSLEG